MDAQKKSFLYQERNPLQRREFLEQLNLIAPQNRVYIDEAGVEDTLSYAYGWSVRGQRCWAERLGHRTERVSMTAAWCCSQVPAPLTFEGYCNRDLIEAWFKLELAPVLRAGQVVILDNASFHRAKHLAEILAQVGYGLLFLPPYSPDLNRIEPLWNTLKRKIELDPHPYPSFRLKVDAAFV